MGDSSSKRFYITTTLPYVNADPHLGHALEFVRADIVARYKKLTGHDVFLNTGSDEHGLKVYRKSREESIDTQEYVNGYADRFKKLVRDLGLLEEINFIRTTDPDHKRSAQVFWLKCQEAGDIYKKEYKVKYCVGCELEKTESELVDGKCPVHPHLDLEVIEEENYFFRFSNYTKPLLDFYEKNPDFVIPDFRFNEIKRFVERGLEDFSISRLKSKMPWGVEVPDDPDHVMYVWFDALVNYISAIGWPEDTDRFNYWWPVTQYAGKDNLRQQSAMWQAMLMSAGLPPSKQIIINGFILGEGGVKMSKSLGNVVSPGEIIDEYGVDSLRYFLAREVHPFEDSEFTKDRFKESYNANLANGLGNLVSRIMKMSETHLEKSPDIPEGTIPQNFKDAMDSFNIQKAADIIWEKIGGLDLKIQETQPFRLVKTEPEKARDIIRGLVADLYTVGRMLNPIMPQTSKAIKEAVKENKKPETPLFVRKD